MADQVAGLNEETVSTAPSFAPRASLLQAAQGPAALEVADLKEQVKVLHYRLEELKAATQKRESDVSAQLARLEARLGTFEQEFSNKLQPTLLRVIEELEHIKGGEVSREVPAAVSDKDTPASAAPVDVPVEEDEASAPNALVPELPEEELKF